MFHVEPAARVLVLGAFLSAAALAQSYGGTARAQRGAEEQPADAGVVTPPPSKSPAKKRRASSSGTTSSATKRSTAAKKSASAKAGASSSAPAKRDARTVGIGRSCAKRADCASSAQVCLRQRDQRGKTLARGVCALPCASIEAGLTKARPGFPAKDPKTTEKILKVPPPPRCPTRYQCRSKGGDVPIDLCVKG